MVVHDSTARQQDKKSVFIFSFLSGSFAKQTRWMADACSRPYHRLASEWPLTEVQSRDSVSARSQMRLSPGLGGYLMH